MLAAIELNDMGVAVAAGDQIRVVSPGYALLSPQGVLVGRDAYQQSSLEPRRVHRRFWRDLGTDPLTRPVRGARTVADLASLHLSHVWEMAGPGLDEIIMVVPGNLSRPQLGLLLGIAGTLGLPVAGLLDTALAVSRKPHPSHTLLHLDLQLHAAVITVLEQGTRLRVIATRSVDGAGWLDFEDRWLKCIAAQFVRETRFDPLHRAEGEQILRGLLPGWLSALRGVERIGIEMRSADGRVHGIELHRRVLVEATAELNHRLTQLVTSNRGSGPAVLQISHRVRDLAGLSQALAALPELEVVALPAGAAALGALQRAQHIRGGPVNTLTASLPWLTPPRLTPPSTPPPGRAMPSHLVHRGMARRLDPGTFVLATDLPHGTHGLKISASSATAPARCDIVIQARQVILRASDGAVVKVNGEVVEEARPLRIGDSIVVGDTAESIHVIAVPDHEA